MSLLFLKRSATTNSTSVINQNNTNSKSSTNASVSVQNLVSLTTRLNHRYSFLTTPDLTADLTTSANELNDSHSKREREKLNVLKEVISSEKKYLNDLKEIVDGYYDEIAKFKEQDFINHIFSNIKEIYYFTKEFYIMLEDTNLDEVAIASCFIKMHRNFSLLYSTYCQNYKIAYLTSEKLEKDPHIGKIIEKVRIKFGHHLKMATYLQLPVLRITKYHLLLQRYLKLLDQDTFAYTQIMEALDLMRQVNDQINTEMSSNLDKPFDDDLFDSAAASSSNFSMLKLVGLFGSVLKQGNLILNETKTYHHVIVFQNMLLIRKSDLYLSKVICTISNENLGFSPISNSKHCNKSFTVIDYSQKKSGENSEFCQFTLKTRSVDEKKAWQACILQCILNGYGKKLPDNVKKKVLKIDNTKMTSKYESIRMKLSSFKRIKDLRHTIKHDLKRSNSQELKSKQIIETTNAQTTNQPTSKRRLSEHFQSSIKKLLDKKPDKADSLLKSFRKDKISNRLFSNQKFKSNCSILNESNGDTKTQDNDESPIEVKLEYNDHTSHLMNTSYMSVYSSLEKIDQSTILKFESILNENKKLNEFDFCYCDSNDSFSSTSKDIILKQTEELISSNSEEGYYSNHDSSSTVSTLINEQSMDIDDSSNKPDLSNYRFNIPVDYSRFSYNCYSNENNDEQKVEETIQQQKLLESPLLPQIIDVNESQVRLTRNKFSSLSSLKQDYSTQTNSFPSINKSNSYVSEIKLFFDNQSIPFVNQHSSSKETKLNLSSESDVGFKVNIKDLISKFEKNK